MVSPAIVRFAVPASWEIGGVIDKKTEFAKDDIKEIPVTEAVGWDDTTHGHQWI